MAYEKTLIKAEKHMTKKYDATFAEVEGLRWYPWVGKNYDKGRILILGMSTYYKEGKDWTERWLNLCDSVNPSRVLVVQGLDSAHGKRDDRRPYEAMSKMFVGAKDKHYGRRAEIFWESVAFNNHCQKVVKGSKGKCSSKKADKADNNRAFRETIKILKPRLCLVWTTEIWKLGSNGSEYRECRQKFTNAIPRVVDDQVSPVVGIHHPSWWVHPKWWAHPNAGDEKMKEACREWRKFLLTDPASKKPVTDFIAYLQSQPVE